MRKQFAVPYVFTRAEYPVFSEIYFPKKISYQGTIFKALERGLNERIVKAYLKKNATHLLEELKGYPEILNPYQFGNVLGKRSGPITPAEAGQRIAMYRSYFQGWSMYEVDGVWLSEGGRIDEERTQVIRLMFRFRSALHDKAEEMDCGDALRAMHHWFMGFRGQLWEQKQWHSYEKKKFLDFRRPWPKHKRQFADENFEAVMKEATKWLEDCALFTFGYLVREFWEIVLERGRREDEIWVTSLYNLNLNVVRQLTRISQRKEEE